jgi:hypothetical protein
MVEPNPGTKLNRREAEMWRNAEFFEWCGKMQELNREDAKAQRFAKI